MTKIRHEADAAGRVEIAADRYWGAQTERARAVFDYGPDRMPVPILRSFGLQKMAAAHANLRLGELDAERARLIETAAQELAEGRFDDHFPLPLWQTGSGTQTNMNANEVIANRANELAGEPLGTRAPVHPNDHVNRGQSSNDTFPTAMNLAVALALDDALLPALSRLVEVLEDRANAFAGSVKIMRTHLNDAVPGTMGEVFGAYARQISRAGKRLEACREDIAWLAQGGTAAGTGLNAHPAFAETFCEELSALTGRTFRPNPVKLEGMAAHDDLVALNGTLGATATALVKICNDLRLLGSGPRCGLGELVIPDDGLTSSIMPGKRNATLAEALVQVCFRVIGNQASATAAGGSGLFELNVAKPLLARVTLESIDLMAGAVDAFGERLVRRLEVNEGQLAINVSRSLMLATALTPILGYDKVAEITRLAEREGLTVREATLRLGHLGAERFDALIDPAAMASPHAWAAQA